MGKIGTAAACALAIAMALPAWPEDLSAIRQALEEKYALTTATADKMEIVTPGAALVLKKSNLVAVDAKAINMYQNKYINGRISQNAIGRTTGWLKRLPGAGTPDVSERTFVSGESLWLTGIEVRQSCIVFTLFSDPYSDTRYGATLTFPFAKGSTPSVNEALAMVGEVFNVQPPDRGMQQQAQGPEQGQVWSESPAPRSESPAPRVATPAARPVEAPPPPIAPPPPPPADPTMIETGQTPAQVTAKLGQPNKIVNLGAKQIYIYKDLKVTFVASKVTDVQ